MSRITNSTTKAIFSQQLDQAARRIIQDVITEASAAYWERRAVEFEAVGTIEADQTAKACRRHASLFRSRAFAEPWPGFSDDLDHAITEYEEGVDHARNQYAA